MTPTLMLNEIDYQIYKFKEVNCQLPRPNGHLISMPLEKLFSVWDSLVQLSMAIATLGELTIFLLHSTAI